MTPVELDQARKMRAAGESDFYIASRLGVSRQHVHKMLGPRPKRRPKPRVASTGPTRSEFAAKLRDWRSARGITQAEAAKLLRVNKQVVSFWETERTGCSLAASMLLLMELLP